MRFYPPAKKDCPVWLARVRSLKEHGQHDDSPTVLNIEAYPLALDEYCDEQRVKLKQQIRRAEDAEIRVRRLQVRLATAEARAAAAQSNESEAKEAHLVGRARRRMQVLEDEDPLVLDKIPVAQGSGKRKSPSALVAPPPTEVSPKTSDSEAAEDPLPLTQPGLRVDVRSLLLPIGEEPTQANESS